MLRRPSVVHNFKYDYLCNQWADHNEILQEASLGWGKGCIRFWVRSDQNSVVKCFYDDALPELVNNYANRTCFLYLGNDSGEFLQDHCSSVVFFVLFFKFQIT